MSPPTPSRPDEPKAPTRPSRSSYAQVIVDQMFEFVGLCDPRGVLLDANSASLASVAARREDVVGRPFWDCPWWAGTDARDRLRDAIARAARGEFVRFEIDHFGADGGRALVTVDFSIRPVFGPDGEVVYLLPEGRDITERKRAESALAERTAELASLYERLQDLDRRKSDLVANVSHELRTPLTLVLGVSARLLGDGELGERARRDIAVIDRNARVLLAEVEDLLEVARLEAGRAALAVRGTDLAALLRRTVSLFEGAAADAELSMEVDAPAAVEAEVDAPKVQRVLANLVGNAVKFTPRGGRVRCALRADAAIARFDVADSGPGVPVAERARVFERFHQVDASATRRFGGTGLGLSIAAELATLHGGSIQVGDAPEGGALFTFVLPLAAPAGARHATSGDPDTRTTASPAGPPLESPAPATTAANDDRPLVLVVEDHPEMRRFVADVLGERHRVAIARDGVEGIDRARASPPDLVVTDVMMPRASGEHLLAALRADPVLADTPVLVLTAKSDDEVLVRLLRAGADDYVRKPFSPDELVVRAEKLVAVRRAREILRTELRSSSRDLEALAREAAAQRRTLLEIDRAKDRFLAHAAHELKTPLTVMKARAEQLDRAVSPEGGATARAASAMIASMRRLSLVADELLAASELDLGRLRLVREPIDLGAFVAAAVDRASASAPRHRFVVDADASLRVLGDRARLASAVATLLDNAARHSPEGSAIEVEVRADGARAAVTVRDHGVGVPAAMRDQIFEPLSRQGGFVTSLYVARAVVARHGGELRVEAVEEGDGARFRLTLPLPRADEEAAA